MLRIKTIFASLAVTILSLIITFGWFGIGNWNKASNFWAGLFFWIICVMCNVISIFVIRVVNLAFPFKVSIVMTNVLYYIIFVGVVSFGVFTIPQMTFIFLNLLLLFLYLVISVPILLNGLKEEGE